jgi:glycosyltransferase involved in cell wall biosynthesis
MSCDHTPFMRERKGSRMMRDKTKVPTRPTPGPRILCISPFFPPVANSESFCGGKLIRELAARGLDLSVLYCSNVDGPNPRKDNSSFWSSFEGIATDVTIPAQNNRARSYFLAAKYRTHMYVRWLDTLVQAASALHTERKFDVVYSRSLPTVAHLAGFWCAKSLKLPWIANMNDPWDAFLIPGRHNEASPLHVTISTNWFKKTVNGADVIIYPCERLRQFHARVSRIDRAAVIMPHIGYEVLPVDGAQEQMPSSIFHLVHAGKLGSNEKPPRSAAALLLAFRQFLETHPEARESTRLTLVGPRDTHTDEHIFSLGLEQNTRSTGSVSYEESLAYIASATVCVLVEANLEEGIFLPSKLVDYLSARKPVLALSPRVGVASDLAAQGGILRVDPTAPEAIEAAICSLYSDFRAGTLVDRAPHDNLASQFSSRAVCDKFLQVLEQLGIYKKDLTPEPLIAASI